MKAHGIIVAAVILLLLSAVFLAPGRTDAGAWTAVDELSAAEDRRARACFKYGLQVGRLVELNRELHRPPPTVSRSACSLHKGDERP